MDLSKYAAGTKKYMSKDLWDPGKGEKLTIANITEVEFQNRDGTTQKKLVVAWVEDRPPLTLNMTNLNWLLGTFGPREEHWQGKHVYAFHDPTVKYAGKLVGGVVLDAAKPGGADPGLKAELRRKISQAKGFSDAGAEQQKQDQQAAGDPSDDIPF